VSSHNNNMQEKFEGTKGRLIRTYIVIRRIDNTVVSNLFYSVKILLFSSARSHDFDGLIGIELPVSMYTNFFFIKLMMSLGQAVLLMASQMLNLWCKICIYGCQSADVSTKIRRMITIKHHQYTATTCVNHI
jgi:hypothetical protein